MRNAELLDHPSQARVPGRFAWQHEALVVSWVGRDKAPRLINAETWLVFLRKAFSRPMLPALIAPNPGPRIEILQK